jgi:integrase
LDSLTENDFINLNLAMRKKGMLSAQDYRKILKQFLDIEIKPKLQTIEQKYNLGELMKSRYLKAPQQKNVDRKPLVDPETFWNKQEIERYLISSQEHSLRQSAWAGLWLSSGCRPHELLSLIKKDISFDGTYLTITIQQGKTGKRQIKLNGNYGKVLYFLI